MGFVAFVRESQESLILGYYAPYIGCERSIETFVRWYRRLLVSSFEIFNQFLKSGSFHEVFILKIDRIFTPTFFIP